MILRQEIILNLACRLIVVLSITIGGYYTLGSLLTLAAGIHQSNDNLADKADEIAGVWELYLSARENGLDLDDPTNKPVLITFKVEGNGGNKLSGTATVLNLVSTTSRVTSDGFKSIPLNDVKFNGKNLTLRANDQENTIEAALTKISNNRFVGEWRSPINGRWKSSKKEFAGRLKMIKKQ